MSRVQKPIRKKLKDAVGKTEEPKSAELPPAAPAKESTIPRKPRPAVVQPEAKAPLKRRPRVLEATGEEQAAFAPPRKQMAVRPAKLTERSENERVNGDKAEASGSDQTAFVPAASRRGQAERPEKAEYNGGRRNGDGERGSRDRGGRNDRGGKGGFGGRKPGEKKKPPEKIVYEKTKQFVFPGETVGAIEEYKPGFGTVNDDGTIRATIPGVIGINKELRMISVIPKTKTPNTITEGDIVIASVTDVRESNARVDIAAAEKSLNEEIVNNGNAEIYVSNIKDGFAKSVADEFRVGDIVRAKVIDSKKIGLSTVEPEFGVLKAYCSKCKTSLTKIDDGLVCGNCGNRERRKLADGYGKGIPCAP